MLFTQLENFITIRLHYLYPPATLSMAYSFFIIVVNLSFIHLFHNLFISLSFLLNQFYILKSQLYIACFHDRAYKDKHVTYYFFYSLQRWLWQRTSLFCRSAPKRHSCHNVWPPLVVHIWSRIKITPSTISALGVSHAEWSTRFGLQQSEDPRKKAQLLCSTFRFPVITIGSYDLRGATIARRFVELT